MKNPLTLSLLMACVGSMMVSQLSAQTFKTLHNFGGGDGGVVNSGLILSSNTLYGTTLDTVFALNTDGTSFRTLASTGGMGGLVLSGNTLYWTTPFGAAFYGSVFTVNTDGTGFTTLYDFSGGDGSHPYCDLLLSGSTLYGTTQIGGDLATGAGGYGSGTVFAINTDGSGFISLYSFSGGNDGYEPFAGLVLSNNILFGTTAYGGTSANGSYVGSGTAFAINTDGTGFTNLYSFTAPSTNSSGVYTNCDGLNPRAGLLLSGGSFYGVTSGGGIFGEGTIFRLQADGSGFTNLYNFPELPTSGPSTNNDGAQPLAVLTISGRTLYGTTSSGGIYGNGTVFALNTDGAGFTNLYNFTGGVEGAAPRGGFMLSGNALYGTTYGTASGYGTIFSISLPAALPQLTITPAAGDVVLSWPTNSIGFTLQSTTNLGSSAIWTTNLPAPVVVNGEYTVTNPISGTRQFYRLTQ